MCDGGSRRLDTNRIAQALEEYVNRISTDQNTLAVVLYGSLATERYTGSSDVDLLIILADSSERFLDRMAAYIDPAFPAPLDPKVYTVAEIRSGQWGPGSFVERALVGGRYLYKKPGVKLLR